MTADSAVTITTTSSNSNATALLQVPQQLQNDKEEEEPTTAEEEDDDGNSLLLMIPESSAYWSKEPYAWSTSLDDGRSIPPLLTSSSCTRALYDLLHNTYYGNNQNNPNLLLSVVVESSSHPTGLDSLYAQPYLYAGPGLGNLDECPLQTCLAGGKSTDSFTFASVCMVGECSAYDLASRDFIAVLQRQLGDLEPSSHSRTLGREYLELINNTMAINQFLNTGWTCGAFVVPWSTFGPYYIGIVAVFGILCLYATCGGVNRRRTSRSLFPPKNTANKTNHNHNNSVVVVLEDDDDDACCLTEQETSSLLPSPQSSSVLEDDDMIDQDTARTSAWWWYDAFDISSHLETLVAPNVRPTSILDGVRVFSMLWIMLGHCMAIQSSMGAGYANPANFLPPTGLTTTLIGQLLFSSRLAVDSFLVVSGFLVVFVLYHKLPLAITTTNDRPWYHCCSVCRRYLVQLPKLVGTRLIRVAPVYFMCLGFYTQIAPHLGGGPFWHQWIGLLKPCHDWAWTNVLFLNNFVPFDTPTTQTCFYHSWYLAVDMQLFLVAPLLVFWYQANRQGGKLMTVALFALSVSLTAYLTVVRQWSLNTLDGAAVDRYDMEAYAKPHARAQSYLAGMFVAMLLHEEQEASMNQIGMWRRPFYNTQHCMAVALAIAAMCLVSFITVTGAYARRPCTYGEDAFVDACGSAWPPYVTLLYTAFSRTVWVVSLSVLIYVCVGRTRESWVANILSWRCWTPLSQLSFGAYLIHPIVIFTWKLADREKDTFRLPTFGMDFLSVCAVSYVCALIAAVVVEFPCATLWKNFLSRREEQRRTAVSQSSSMNSLDSPMTAVKYGSMLPSTTKS